MTYRKVILGSPLGDFVFSTHETDPALESHLTDLKGWHGGVGVTEAGPQRALGHGAFPQRAYRGPRSVTLEGLIHVEDDAMRDRAEVLTSAALADGDFWPITVTQGALTTWAMVQLDGEIGFTYVGEHAVRVQIPMRTADPYKYGPEKETTLNTPGTGVGLKWDGGLFTGGFLRWGGSVAPGRMTNDGTTDAWPVFMVSGEFPEGFTITVNGRSVEWPGVVTKRAPVWVDYGAGTVTIGSRDNGTDATHMLVRRQWEPIPPGRSIVPKLVPRSRLSEGWAVAVHADTYI